MRFVVPFFGVLLLSGAAAAAPPSACQPDRQGQVDFQVCADAADRGSPERRLALINLGTKAFLSQDYAKAVRYYDEAQPPGGQRIFSDANFHAFRAVAYSHVGRTAEGLADARTAWQMLQGKDFAGRPLAADDPELVLASILPILKRGADPGFPGALSAYRSLPARDWISYANRTSLLIEIDDLSGAMDASREALKLQPGHPQVLNNSCYLLTKLDRAGEGLPYCERAVAAAPRIAAIRDSYAAALAASGHCAQADAELATARRLDPVSVEYQRKLACTAP